MAGTITGLRYQKRNENRVNVYIDGQFALGLTAIEAVRLQVGQRLTDEEIARLRMRDTVERAYERALNYLSYRPRSEAEVCRNLRKKGVEDEVVEAVIERLKRARLLSDEEFARYWVENRFQFNPRGLRGLRYELRQKGVPDAVIDRALTDFDVDAAAGKAAEAGARRLRHLKPRDFRRKLRAYLARRGFSYAIIRPLVEEKLEEIRCERTSKTDIESEGKDHGW